MKAVIYARYSSHSQREESIEGQLRECHDFARKNEMTIIQEYCDRAISGKTDNRPEFQRLIKDSEKHQFQAVIMYTLDRFARNRYDSAIYKAKLKKNGVKVYYAKQPLPDTPESIILESVMEGYAEYYSENLARNVKRGLQENAMKGIAMGRPILGYRKTADRKFEIDPFGAEAVKLIFEMYANGAKISDIANTLNAKGYKNSQGGKFTNESFSRILCNQRYLGNYVFGETVIEGAIPQIIDRELFDKAVKRKNSNKHSHPHNKAKDIYIFTGKIFCGNCGGTMVGCASTSGSGQLNMYYICHDKYRKKNDCTMPGIRKDWLEETVIEFTLNNILTDGTILKIAEKVTELNEREKSETAQVPMLEGAIINCDKRTNNLIRAIEQGIAPSDVKKRIDEIAEEKLALETELARAKIETPSLTKEHIIYWLSQFRKGDTKSIEYQKVIADTLINSVRVYNCDDGKSREIIIAYNISGHEEVKLKGAYKRSTLGYGGVISIHAPHGARRPYLQK